MTSMPAHKDTKNPAGQIRNDITLADYIKSKQDSFDRYPYLKHGSIAEHRHNAKLTFDEWWAKNWPCEDEAMCRIIWEEAQENVPSQAPGTRA